MVAEGASTGCWTEVLQLGNEAPSEQGHFERENASFSPPSLTDSFSSVALSFLSPLLHCLSWSRCSQRTIQPFWR